MKQILLLAICAISFQFMTNAQTVSISPGEITNTMDLDNLGTDDPTDINGHSVVTHNENVTKTFVWVRNEVYVPDGWEISICDINSCWFHTVSTKEFDLEANFEGTMDVHAYPAGSPDAELIDEVTTGEAIVEITISEVGNESNTTTATYTLSLTGTVSVETLDREDVKVYPNPTTDFFKLTETDVVDRLVVRNLVGKDVKTFEVSKGASYNISELPIGIYLVTLMNEENIVRTIRISKK